MGRYLGYAILHTVAFDATQTDSVIGALQERYPVDLFDYQTFNEGYIRIRSDITPQNIADLRLRILEVCGLPGEKGDEEKELDARIRSSDFKTLLDNPIGGYTFSNYDRPWCIFLDGSYIYTRNYYFVLYWGAKKFLPNDAGGEHEVSVNMTRLMRLNLSGLKGADLVYGLLPL